MQFAAISPLVQSTPETIVNHCLYVVNKGVFPIKTLETTDLSNSVLFVPIGYQVDPQVLGCEGHAITFNQEFVEKTISGVQGESFSQKLDRALPSVYLQNNWVAMIRDVAKTYDLIINATSQKADIYTKVLSTLAVNYLYELMGQNLPWVIPQRRLGKVTSDFLALLEVQFLCYRRPREYAKMLFVSESSLLKHCQHELGMTPSMVIHQRLIKEARLLLLTTSLSMSDISDKLSFNTPSYFAERFRQSIGMSPQTFRKLYSIK